jgi:hypothetical protein
MCCYKIKKLPSCSPSQSSIFLTWREISPAYCREAERWRLHTPIACLLFAWRWRLQETKKGQNNTASSFVYHGVNTWGLHSCGYERPSLWSSGQSSWLQIQRSKFDSRRYHIVWEVVGLERCPLSLMSITEELLERKSSDSGLQNSEYGRRDPSRWSRGTLYPQKLVSTSPISGCRTVGIVRSRTKTKESVFLWLWRVVCWDIPPCSPFTVNRSFGGGYRLHFQCQSQLATCFHAGFLLSLLFEPEDHGDMFLRNVGWLSAEYTALCSRRQSSSAFSTPSSERGGDRKSMETTFSEYRHLRILIERRFNPAISASEKWPGRKLLVCSSFNELNIKHWNQWYINITITILDIIHHPVFYLKLTGNTLRFRYESNKLMLSTGSWRRYINITITVLNIILRPIFYREREKVGGGSEGHYIRGDCLSKKSQSHVTTDGQSVGQYVVASDSLWNTWPDIIFCLKVAVLSLLGALSVERSGLSPVSHFHQCLVHCQRFNIIYIVHVTCFEYM